MKKTLFAVLIAMLATSASATVARLKSLGNDEIDTEGSYYIHDCRNIFLNVANVNDCADTLIYEWGNTGTKTVGAQTTNERSRVSGDAAPISSGGFLRQSGNTVYGAYLGNESLTSQFLRLLSSGRGAADVSNNTLPTSDNQIDLFYGSKSGSMSWGANLVYSAQENKPATGSVGKYEDNSLAVRLGAKTDKWDAHANISLANSAELTVSNTNAGITATDDVKTEFDGSLGFHVGGGYAMGPGRVFGYYKTLKWDAKDTANYSSGYAGATAGKTGTSESEFTTIMFGYGMVKEYGPSKVYTKLYAKKTSVEVNSNLKAEVNETKIPVVVGFEHMATGWLTLRGSVIQNIHSKKDNKNYAGLNKFGQTLATGTFGAEGEGKANNSTTVQAGASLNFGKLIVDGFIGVTNTGAKSNIGSLDRALTRVGMTYSF